MFSYTIYAIKTPIDSILFFMDEVSTKLNTLLSYLGC